MSESEPNPNAPCVVWHPDIHRNYGESLSYVFLHVRQYGQSHRDQIQRLFGALGLSGFCYYDVFGSVDVVLRVWSRSDSRHRLLEGLGKLGGVTVKSIFVCTDTPRYLWWRDLKPTLDPTDIFDFDPGELSKVQTPGTGSEGLLAELQARGFVSRSPVDGNGGSIKFFVRVAMFSAVNKEQWLDALTVLTQKNPQIRNASIYYGSGFECLIKATTQNYYAIGDFVIAVIRSTAVECTTETHLIATHPVRESDDVDFAGAFIDAPLHRMCELWQIERDAVRSLPEEKRRVLSDMFTRVAQRRLYANDHRGILETCFKSYVHARPEDMDEKLVFLKDIERKLFAPVVPRIMAETYGADWHRDSLEELAKRAKISHRFSPDQWDLGDSVNLLGVVDKDHEGHVSKVLGDGWQPPLRAAVKLRNDFFHGKLDSSLHWTTIVESLLDVMPVYYRISDRADELKRSRVS